jgi:GAF domain-containing protein
VDHFCGPVRPAGTGEAAARPVSVLAVPLQRDNQRVLGALTLYAEQPAALDETAELLTGALATFAAAELERHTLHRAISTRQLIGQAVGVLVERHRMTPEAAFAVLARRSQETNVALSTIAQIVVETGQEPSEITRP